MGYLLKPVCLLSSSKYEEHGLLTADDPSIVSCPVIGLAVKGEVPFPRVLRSRESELPRSPEKRT